MRVNADPEAGSGYAQAVGKRTKKKKLTPEELEAQDGQPLPDREAMSVMPIGDPIVGLPLPVDVDEGPLGEEEGDKTPKRCSRP
jgi:hypothetical protein